MKRILEHLPREECEHRALAALDEARPMNAATLAGHIWPGHDGSPQAAALAADGIMQPMRRRGLVRHGKGGWTKSSRPTPGDPATATAAKEHQMSDGNTRLYRRWSPHGPHGAAEPMGPDAILAGDWLDDPSYGTREVDLYSAHRALTQEGMAHRLFDAGTGDLAASLARHPHIEHLAGARITFSDLGTTIVLDDGEEVPAGKRHHVNQLCAVLTLRKGGDPPRTMRVAADIAFIGNRAEDGFVLGRSTRISAEEAADAMMEVFGAELDLEAAANCDEDPGRLRDAIEEEAVRILEGNDAASLRRIHNTTRRKIQPIMPAGHGVWIEIGADSRIQVGFQ